MTPRTLQLPTLVLAAAIGGCGGCSDPDERETRRIDLGLGQPRQESAPAPTSEDPAAPAGEEIAGDPEAGDPGAGDPEAGDPAEPVKEAGAPNAGAEPAEAVAGAAAATPAAGASSPQQP